MIGTEDWTEGMEAPARVGRRYLALGNINIGYLARYGCYRVPIITPGRIHFFGGVGGGGLVGFPRAWFRSSSIKYFMKLLDRLGSAACMSTSGRWFRHKFPYPSPLPAVTDRPDHGRSEYLRRYDVLAGHLDGNPGFGGSVECEKSAREDTASVVAIMAVMAMGVLG